jgi:biotin operon repressor
MAAKHREPPNKAVADALQISRGAAAKAVTTAREHGLLPKTRKGRVGPVEGS